MKTHEVVVTGVGLIGPLGTTAREFAQAWQNGSAAVRHPLRELASTPLEAEAAAHVPPFDAAARLGSRRMLKYMSPAALLGCVAAREALTEAAARERFDPWQIGLYAGTGLAAATVDDVKTLIQESIDEHGKFSCRLLGARGLAATNPLLSFRILANMPPCLISVIEGIRGPNLIFTPWEGQTAAALLEGWWAVATGEVACALVGAADTAAFPSTFVYLRQAKLLEKNEYPACGAGYVVLETEATANRDGRPIHARIRAMDVTSSGTGVADPLSPRIGRTFAAAPAVLLGLAALCGWPSMSISGVDRQALHVEFGKRP